MGRGQGKTRQKPPDQKETTSSPLKPMPIELFFQPDSNYAPFEVYPTHFRGIYVQINLQLLLDLYAMFQP